MHRNVKYKDGTNLNYGTVLGRSLFFYWPSTSLGNSAPLTQSYARITQLLLKKIFFWAGVGAGGLKMNLRCYFIASLRDSYHRIILTTWHFFF